MTLMLLGIALFFGPHTYSAFRSRHPAHDVRAKREPIYMTVYSVVSLIGLVLIVQGYQRWEDWEVLWVGPEWARWVSAVVMMPALILFAAGNLPAGKIKHWLGHPMVMGTLLWASVHLLSGFSDRALLLFLPFALWAAVDLIKASRREPKPVVPQVKWDVIAVGVGVAAYALLLLWAHEAWMGYSPLPA